MAITKETLGSAVKKVRTVRGLTQAELAEAAGFAKSGKSIALIEQGKRSMSVDALNAIADALDIPPACLAILGSTHIGKPKHKTATDFMQSLQHLISTVLLADRSLEMKEKAETTRKEALAAESRQFQEVAELFDVYAKKTEKQGSRKRPVAV